MHFIKNMYDSPEQICVESLSEAEEEKVSSGGEGGTAEINRGRQ